MLETILTWLLSVPGWVLAWLLRWGRENPTSLFLIVLAIVRSFGTTVQTGWAGVLFSFGKAKKVLQPGFHPLIPIFQKVRQTPIRSITLDLSRQRVTTRDGLVFDVHANIIYRVDDPILALTSIDDIRKGVLTMLPLLVLAMMREQDGTGVLTPHALDAELTTKAREALARWGVGVEQAGLATIAPTAPTMRLTQLGLRVAERAALLDLDTIGDVPAEVVVALVTTARTPKGRSHAKYHRRKRRRLAVVPPPPAPA